VASPGLNSIGTTVIALHVVRRPGATEPDATAFPVPPEGLVIGRSPECDLVLADPLRGVSRQHARVAVAGQDAFVTCISSTSPLWVNDTQLPPGGQSTLSAGDCLRIGAFELAVECIAAPVAPRARLDRWFNLDGAHDPLAAQSPLPALAAASEAAPASAVVSWKTDLLVVRTGPPLVRSAPSMQPASQPPQAAVSAQPPQPASASAAGPIASLSSTSASTAGGGAP